MKQYVVQVIYTAVVVDTYLVEANSKDEAGRKVLAGDYDDLTHQTVHESEGNESIALIEES